MSDCPSIPGSAVPPPIPGAPLPPPEEESNAPWSLWRAFISVYWYRYAQLGGRAPRCEYWLSWVPYVVVTLVLGGIAALFFDPHMCDSCGCAWREPTAPLFIGTLLLLGGWLGHTHLAGITLLSRRLHDVGMSEWWLVLLLCDRPLLLGSLASAAGYAWLANGEQAPDAAELLLHTGAVLGAIGLLLSLFRLIIGLLPSDGANRWGAAPENPAGRLAWSPWRVVRRLFRGHFVDFSGRACRQELWCFSAAYGILAALPCVLPCLCSSVMFAAGCEWRTVCIISCLMLVLLILALGCCMVVPALSLSARRCHDIGISAKWLILYYALSVPVALLTEGDCEGWTPMLTIALICWAAQLVFGVMLCVLPSAAPNRWGARAQLPYE